MPSDEYEVRRADAEKALHSLAEQIDAATPDDMGFALLLFDFGESGAMFYISNGERDDVIAAMREFIARQEGTGR